MTNQPCRACGETALTCSGEVGLRPRSVTSDSLLCDLAPVLWRCVRCGHLQKLPTASELAQIERIYAEYRPHHLSGGREQLVFPPDRPPRPRSYHCLEQCLSALPESGRLLDVGAGNGAFLKSAQALLPGWALNGFDLGERHRGEIEAMTGVESFWSGDLAAVPDRSFDLAVLWHTLEHVPEPVETLAQIAAKLAPGGRILIQVPNVERNPFDLAVIDHASHFGASQLRAVCARASLDVALDGEAWVHNCLTVMVEAGAPTAQPAISHEPGWTVSWLRDALTAVDEEIDGDPFAIFGTGMAGLWLSGQFAQPPVCFVDEDESRAGQHVEGAMIVTPDTVDSTLPILMSFMPDTASAITAKVVERHPRLAATRFLVPEPSPSR